MAREHPDASKQFGIRLSDEAMELVSLIQDYRKRNSEPFTLSAIVEDAVHVYYDRLVEEGLVSDKL